MNFKGGKVVWHETGPQRRARLKRKRQKEERLREMRNNRTPEQRQLLLERHRLMLERQRERAQDPEVQQEKTSRLKTYRRKLRNRCELEQQSSTRCKTVGRFRNQDTVVKYVKKRRGPKPRIKEELEESDPDETPEEFVERKRYNFMCMEMEAEMTSIKYIMRKEKEKTAQLGKQLEKMHERAKELENFYGIPICTNKMYKYRMSPWFIE